MLFNDYDPVCGLDLQVIDPEVLAVAAVENIVVDGPASITRETVESCGHDIMARFQNFSGYLLSPGVNLNHQAAVMNILTTAISRPRMRLNQVVVMEPDPSLCMMHRWVKFRVLKEIYAAAFRRFNKSADRYQAKRDAWDEEATKCWRRIESQGVSVVLIPLPVPGAVREFNVGTFTQSNVSMGGSGSADPGAQQYIVAITWTGSQPYGQGYQNPLTKNNSESGWSAIISVNSTVGQVISVSIANLTPPNNASFPAIGTAAGLYTVMSATGWNIYVGQSPVGLGAAPTGQPSINTLWLQNSTPIPIGTTSFTLPNAPIGNTYPLQPGQTPDFAFSCMNVLQRA
jgi:hypothetical protein